MTTKIITIQMNYRHIYHAGNFADVVKHLLLIQVIERLKLKDTPFFVLDTHAGIGIYDLESEQAQKTKEADAGIAALWNAEIKNQDIIDYINLVKGFNPDGNLKYYMGSPMVAASIMRGDDRLLANELHPADQEQLAINLKTLLKRVKTTRIDAYHSLLANLPPKERRGMVLIDPPFEDKNEFETLAKELKQAIKRWSIGTYLIWFPLKTHLPIEQFYKEVKALNVPKTLLIECWIADKNTPENLNGCGMIVLNTPWLVDDRMRDMTPELEKFVCEKVEMRWLVEPVG
jgi:23S rRNA (adenine2030-N6)-methyltransferase